MEPPFSFIRRLRTVSNRDVDHLRESFLAHAEAFNPTQMSDHLLFPEQMTWYYGEPVYEALSEDRRLMLNHLTFCMSYYSTAVAEAATNVLNYEAALQALIDDDPEVALYMAREVVEETAHIEAFWIVIKKVLAHYGLTLDDLRAKNISLPMATRYVQAHSLLGWLRGNLDYYYFTRFALNVNQKTVERCTIDEPRMHPSVRELLRSHAIDEARHMQMSRGMGKAALGRMRTRVERNLACIGYAKFASRIYMGRHKPDGRLPRATRTGTLELCGVPTKEAARAYAEWRDRVHTRLDPPLVRAARVYYLKQNFAYIDELDVSDRIRRYMKRTIAKAYSDAAEAERDGTLRPLHFDELTRTA